MHYRVQAVFLELPPSTNTCFLKAKTWTHCAWPFLIPIPHLGMQNISLHSSLLASLEMRRIKTNLRLHRKDQSWITMDQLMDSYGQEHKAPTLKNLCRETLCAIYFTRSLATSKLVAKYLQKIVKCFDNRLELLVTTTRKVQMRLAGVAGTLQW